MRLRLRHRSRRRSRARLRCTESGGCACRPQTGCSAWRDGWFQAPPIPAAPADRAPRRPVSAAGRGIRAGPWRLLFWPEGLSGELALFAHEHFDTRFRRFELLAARFAESDTALEELERAFQRKVAGLELFDYFFELFKAGFEAFDRLRVVRGVASVLRHRFILTALLQPLHQHQRIHTARHAPENHRAFVVRHRDRLAAAARTHAAVELIDHLRAPALERQPEKIEALRSHDVDRAPAHRPEIDVGQPLVRHRLLAAIRAHAPKDRAGGRIEPFSVGRLENVAGSRRHAHRIASRGPDLPDLALLSYRRPLVVDPLPVVRPARTHFVTGVAGQALRFAAVHTDDIDIARPPGVTIEDNLLIVGRPRRAADRGPVKKGQLRLIAAIGIGDPDFLRPGAIAGECDMRAILRNGQVAVQSGRVHQRLHFGPAPPSQRRFEDLALELAGDIHGAAGLTRHRRLARYHARRRHANRRAAGARHPPQRS